MYNQLPAISFFPWIIVCEGCKTTFQIVNLHLFGARHRQPKLMQRIVDLTYILYRLKRGNDNQRRTKSRFKTGTVCALIKKTRWGQPYVEVSEVFILYLLLTLAFISAKLIFPYKVYNHLLHKINNQSHKFGLPVDDQDFGREDRGIGAIWTKSGARWLVFLISVGVNITCVTIYFVLWFQGPLKLLLVILLEG